MTTITFGQLGHQHEGKILRVEQGGRIRSGKPEDIAHYVGTNMTSVRFVGEGAAIFGNPHTPIEIVDDHGVDMQPIATYDKAHAAAVEVIAEILGGLNAHGDVFAKPAASTIKLNRAGLERVIRAVQTATLADVRSLSEALLHDGPDINHEENNYGAGYAEALTDVIAFVDDGIDNESASNLFPDPAAAAAELEHVQNIVDGNTRPE